jgi:excisionase family DNA binding protein
VAGIDEILTRAEAAGRLGIAYGTVAKQVENGRLPARLVGDTYVTTVDEVERYRRERLGRIGRPPAIDPRAVRTYALNGVSAGRPGEAWVIEYHGEAFEIDAGGGNQVPFVFTTGAAMRAIESRAKAVAPFSGFDPLAAQGIKAKLGLPLSVARLVYVGFPEPAVVFQAGPVWNAEAFETWLATAEQYSPPRWTIPPAKVGRFTASKAGP